MAQLYSAPPPAACYCRYADHDKCSVESTRPTVDQEGTSSLCHAPMAATTAKAKNYVTTPGVSHHASRGDAVRHHAPRMQEGGGRQSAHF